MIVTARDILGRRGRAAAASATYLYFLVVLALPVGWLFLEAFGFGPGTLLAKIGSPEALHAFRLTGLVTAIAVVVNAVFGTALAIVLVRHRFPGRALANALVDVPFAVSAVVAGLMMVLLYGPDGVLGAFLDSSGVRVLFALPGIVLATLFVTFPFVVREVAPVLRQAGTEAEEAARTLGARPMTILFRITLPTIRWALGYGVLLTAARSLGEFGAVLLVSGNILGRTQTAPLYVYQAYTDFDLAAAYAVSIVLIAVALAMVVVLEIWKLRRRRIERVRV